ncbi:YicC/YloC family endoribonuclease [Roseobacter sp.]|uniref:YicC/YloC family endoribonuclease n=1 Tax=Roseobacter sp. TaxID=1907202 RepID=UPI003298A668
MIRSMTGFASATGGQPPHAWAWELRSVNGKGLDLRIRVPDWIGGLEADLRKLLSAQVNRGNVTLSLRVTREDQTGAQQVNAAQLATVLEAMAVIETHAKDTGVTLASSTAADIIVLRGVLEQRNDADDAAPLAAALLAEAAGVLADFNAMREAEGAALCRVLDAQLDEIAALTTQAAHFADARSVAMAQALQRNLAKVLDSVDGADPDRVAQELALIAVKTDVTEEIDRLAAHVQAARDLIAQGGSVGRKLDFLMQEFNREANTLCAKAQSTELTQCGLALKAVIDQMREQVQNVE